MKQQLRIAALMLAVAFSSAAFSETKPVTRIDFNKMIDENNHARRELQQDAAIDSEVRPVAKRDDKGKVIDFIDVEIGVGVTPTVTDRRFDSVGAPVVVDVNNL